MIRGWGAAHQAVPATGEATISGATTVVVRDGWRRCATTLDFPGLEPSSSDQLGRMVRAFRPARRLLFVFDERNDDEVATRAHEISCREVAKPDTTVTIGSKPNATSNTTRAARHHPSGPDSSKKQMAFPPWPWPAPVVG